MFKMLLCLLCLVTMGHAATASLTITFTADTNAVTDLQTFLTRQVSAVSSLAAAMGTADTTLSATIPAGIPTSGAILIDSEIITYTGVSGSTLTGLGRGATLTNAANNTVAATHAVNAVIKFLTFNAIRAWVVSVVLSNAQNAIQSLGTASALIGTDITNINTNQTAENTSLAGAVQ